MGTGRRKGCLAALRQRGLPVDGDLITLRRTPSNSLAQSASSAWHWHWHTWQIASVGL